MKVLATHFLHFLINIIVIILNRFIRRDKNIVLIGSWMGQRFADNSRNLYDYLFRNREELNLKRVIWATDNDALIKEMAGHGYDVIKMHSLAGFYWHLRAGIHVVCNMYAKTGKYHGDIIGELSAGAVKIQLWHGVAVKACHYLVRSNESRTIKDKVKSILYSKYFLGSSIFSPGFWRNRYQIATSPENARVTELDYGVCKKHIIEANYPRLNDDVYLFKREEEIIDILKEHKKTKKIVMYCPTFREKKQNDSAYQNPIENKSFCDFLKENDILWVEKRHFASTYKFGNKKNENVFYVDSNFDLSILYRCFDLLITDYSSAASDCIYRNIPVVSFVPDYDDYLNNERGFVADYDSYYPGDKAMDVKQLEDAILQALSADYFTKVRLEEYKNCRSFLFADHACNYEWIYSKIRDVIIGIN